MLQLLYCFFSAESHTASSSANQDALEYGFQRTPAKPKRRACAEEVGPPSRGRRMIDLVNDSWGESWKDRNRATQTPRGKVYAIEELRSVISANVTLINFLQEVLEFGDKVNISAAEFNKMYKLIFGDESVREAKKGSPGHFLYYLPDGWTAIGHTQSEGGKHQADRKGTIRIIGGELKDALDAIGFTVEVLREPPAKLGLDVSL